MQLLALALQAAGPQAVRRLLLSSSSFDGLAQVALRLLSLHIPEVSESTYELRLSQLSYLGSPWITYVLQLHDYLDAKVMNSK